MKFIKQIIKTIENYSLIRPGDTIVAGVSGGPDSMALLEVLDHLRASLGLKIVTAHINHGLRKNAGADERFVEKICRKKNIICESVSVNIPVKPKISLEQAARDKRFKALITIAKRFNADSIALGHHQDDLAETVLMRVLRGSGLQGLQAILPERVIYQHRFIRPLLEINREDILKFLQQKNILFREDPMNKNIKFMRNKIRHQLIPQLKKEYNPQIVETLSRLAETAALDYEFLDDAAKDCFEKALASSTENSLNFSLSKLRKTHPSLRRMVFRRAISMLTQDAFPISLRHIRQIEALLNNPPTQPSIDLPLKLKAFVINPNTLQFKQLS